MISNIDGLCGQCDAIKITSAEIENELPVEYVRIHRASESDPHRWIVEVDLRPGATPPLGVDNESIQLQCQLQTDSCASLFTLMDVQPLESAKPELRYAANILCHEIISAN